MNCSSQKMSLAKFPLITLSFSLLMAVSCGGGNGSSVTVGRNPFGDGPAAVSLSANGGEVLKGDLKSAGSYVILSKAGVTNVPTSSVVGDIGVSPITSAAVTGFSLMGVPSTDTFLTSAQVTGKIYAPNLQAPTPANLTTAIGSMQTAYTDAAGRSNPDFTELASGNLGGLTLAPGLYKWSTNINIPTNFTISGSPNDVWIFQISGNVIMEANKSITLLGGAKAENIYWQVAGNVTIKAGSHFKGILMSATDINFLTGASLQGRAFSQTQVTLDKNSIVEPN